MSRRSRTSALGLIARQFRSDLGVMVAMAAIVLVIATLASSAPLALRSLTSAEVAYQFDNFPAVRRDLVAIAPGSPQFQAGKEPFSTFEAALRTIRDSAPLPLKKSLSTAEFSIATGELNVSRKGVEWNDPLTPITINIAPGLADHVRMTEGSLPGPFSTVIDPTNNSQSPRLFTPFERDPRDPQIEIVLSVKTAKEAGWEVGEERWVAWNQDRGFYAKLSGTFEALNPNDGFWAASRSALEPGIAATSFSGSNTRIVQSAAFIDPGSWPVMAKETNLPVVTNVVIPFTTKGLSVEEDAELGPQLSNFLSTNKSVTNVAAVDTVSSLLFSSEAGDVLGTALSRATIAMIVLVMAASGPIGVAIAALWLLAKLIVLRRRDSVALSSARGASDTQIRTVQAAQVLLVSIPSAAIGCAIGYFLFPDSATPIALWFGVAVALLPGLLTLLAVTPKSLRTTRSDLGINRSTRYRWVFELITFALTGLAVWLLLQRGLTTNAGTAGLDPLLAATPLLLSISAGLIVLRLYPLPLVALAHAAKRGRKIVGFLGANRSIRDPAAGLAPVLAMVVGLAVAAFSGILLGTVTQGVATAAQSKVGADLRIDSGILTEEQLDAIAAVDGVEASASLYQYTQLQNLSVQDNLSVPLMVTDTARLERVQSDVPGAAKIDLDMTKPIGESIPVLLSPDLESQYRITADSTLAGIGIVSAGTSNTSPSLSGVEDWVLIDRANSEAFDIPKFLPKITLLKLEPGASIPKVKAELAKIVGEQATIESPVDAASRLNDSPITGGLQFALLALIVIVALLCAGTVVLALMINAPVRERLLALLRTLGLNRSQARGITAWEIIPTAVVSIFVGSALGFLLPQLVLAGVDLRPFTGGVLQPSVSLDPVLLGAVIGGFALLVILATGIAMAAARRVSLARSLRTSEEG